MPETHLHKVSHLCLTRIVRMCEGDVRNFYPSICGTSCINGESPTASYGELGLFGRPLWPVQCVRGTC